MTASGALRAMAAGYAALSLLSLLRVPIAGTLAMTGDAIHVPYEVLWRVGFALAMGVICWSFVSLLRAEPQDEQLPILFRGALTIHLLAGIALPLTSTDIFTNLAFGHLTHLGFDASRVGASALPEGDAFRVLVPLPYQASSNPYGPLITLHSYLSTFSGNVWLSIYTHKVLSLVMSLGCVWLARGFCARFYSGPWRCRGFLLFALNPVFVWEISGQSHNDAVMLLLLTLGITTAAAGRPWRSLLALALAVLSKFVVLPVLGLQLVHTLRSSAMRGAAMIGALVIVGGLGGWLFGDEIGAWLAVVSSHGVDPYGISNSLSWFAYWAPAPWGEEAQARAFGGFRLLVMGTLAIAGLGAALRTRSLSDVWRESQRFLLLFLLLSPLFQPWHLCWVLPLGMAARDEQAARFVTLFAIVFIAQYPITGRELGSVSILALAIVFVRRGLVPWPWRRA